MISWLLMSSQTLWIPRAPPRQFGGDHVSAGGASSAGSGEGADATGPAGGAGAGLGGSAPQASHATASTTIMARHVCRPRLPGMDRPTARALPPEHAERRPRADIEKCVIRKPAWIARGGHERGPSAIIHSTTRRSLRALRVAISVETKWWAASGASSDDIHLHSRGAGTPRSPRRGGGTPRARGQRGVTARSTARLRSSGAPGWEGSRSKATWKRRRATASRTRWAGEPGTGRAGQLGS